MAFVINVIKWLLSEVETMYFDVVEPVFSTVAKSSLGSISWVTVLISSHHAMCKHNVACQHSQQTRDVDRMLAQHQTSAGSMPGVCWAAGLAVHTAGGE